MNKFYPIIAWTLSLILFLMGCTANQGKEVVATINQEPITQADLELYQTINLIQIAMYKEAEQGKYQGAEKEQADKFWAAREQEAKDRNTLLTQIIRLRAMSMLAKEKGHTASAEEIDKEIRKVKQIYAKSPSAMDLIKQYGENKFWEQQRTQYERIVLVKKVQQDIMDKVKQANPKAGQKELAMLAEKKYEELVVSQVGTLKIKIHS